ncbi:MAG: phosphatase PAP2 family protein [Acidimicrobiia bacterium]
MTRQTTTADRGAPLRQADAALVVGGVVVLVAGMAVVGDGRLPGWEADLFRAVNDLPDALHPVLWLFQQFGAIGAAPVVAAVAWLAGRRRLAVAAVLSMVIKLMSEWVIKALVSRQRPATSIGPDIHLRGDVQVSGESFVSGHAAMAAVLATIAAPWLPERWRIAPWVLVGLVMIGRMYVGAHLPLDVICGAGLGVAVGGALNLVLVRPEPRA